jgi:hypothetical protein
METEFVSEFISALGVVRSQCDGMQVKKTRVVGMSDDPNSTPLAQLQKNSLGGGGDYQEVLQQVQQLQQPQIQQQIQQQPQIQQQIQQPQFLQQIQQPQFQQQIQHQIQQPVQHFQDYEEPDLTLKKARKLSKIKTTSLPEKKKRFAFLRPAFIVAFVVFIILRFGAPEIARVVPMAVDQNGKFTIAGLTMVSLLAGGAYLGITDLLMKVLTWAAM